MLTMYTYHNNNFIYSNYWYCFCCSFLTIACRVEKVGCPSSFPGQTRPLPSPPRKALDDLCRPALRSLHLGVVQTTSGEEREGERGRSGSGRRFPGFLFVWLVSFLCPFCALLDPEVVPRRRRLCSSLQHGVQLVCQVIKHAADVVQDAHCALVLGQRAAGTDSQKQGYYNQ